MIQIRGKRRVLANVALPAHAEIGWPFTAGHARASGLSQSTVARRVRSGAWVRLQSGVYAVTGASHPQQAIAGAVYAAGPRAVISHRSAAQLHGIELWEAATEPTLTLPTHAGRPALVGVRVHHGDLADDERDEVITIGPPRVRWSLTDVGRTLTDLALTCAPLEAVVALDSALRNARLSVAELRWLAERRQGQPGARQLRQVVGLADPAAESVLESVLRTLLCLAGLPRPTSQHKVRDERGRAWRIDLAYVEARVALEADGRHHDERGQFERDRQRQNALVNLGWRVLRFTHHDLRFRQEQVVAEVRAALTLAPH